VLVVLVGAGKDDAASGHRDPRTASRPVGQLVEGAGEGVDAVVVGRVRAGGDLVEELARVPTRRRG
jgi:hypothetical protein